MSPNLAEKHCVPCEGGTPPFTLEQAQAYLPHVAKEWSLHEGGKKLYRKLSFKNFRAALDFANRIGEIAESEGHHPDLEIGWGYVHIKLTTHAVRGLSENDFILAAKIDGLLKN